jgi:hypothetical protein
VCEVSWLVDRWVVVVRMEECRKWGGRRTGIHAAVAIHDTINTVVGTSPKNGFINDASYIVSVSP